MNLKPDSSWIKSGIYKKRLFEYIKTAPLEELKKLVPDVTYADYDMGNGHTMYTRAVISGRTDFMKYLERLGCDYLLFTHDGDHLLDLAYKEKRKNVVDHLMNLYICEVSCLGIPSGKAAARYLFKFKRKGISIMDIFLENYTGDLLGNVGIEKVEKYLLENKSKITRELCKKISSPFNFPLEYNDARFSQFCKNLGIINTEVLLQYPLASIKENIKRAYKDHPEFTVSEIELFLEKHIKSETDKLPYILLFAELGHFSPIVFKYGGNHILEYLMIDYMKLKKIVASQQKIIDSFKDEIEMIPGGSVYKEVEKEFTM